MSVRLGPEGGGVLSNAASGGRCASLSLYDEPACLNVAFHPIAWAVTLRSCCCSIPGPSGSLSLSHWALSIRSTVPVYSLCF